MYSGKLVFTLTHNSVCKAIFKPYILNFYQMKTAKPFKNSQSLTSKQILPWQMFDFIVKNQTYRVLTEINLFAFLLVSLQFELAIVQFTSVQIQKWN